MKNLGHKERFEIWSALKNTWVSRLWGRISGRSVIERVENTARVTGGFVRYSDSLEATSAVTGGHPEDINGMPPDIRPTLNKLDRP